jgi:hypothetical protein
MNGIRNIFRELTMRPQGATATVVAFPPIFAIVSMFPILCP